MRVRRHSDGKEFDILLPAFFDSQLNRWVNDAKEISIAYPASWFTCKKCLWKIMKANEGSVCMKCIRKAAREVRNENKTPR